MMFIRSYKEILHTIVLMLASLTLCCSCIDPYDAELPVSDQQYLVIEGFISGESVCEFYLSRSLSLNPKAEELLNRKVKDASVRICGSDQSAIDVPHIGEGCYQTYVGSLNAGCQYWLEISWEGRTYSSKPATPLHTPAIVDLQYNQPREDLQVDILVTPELTSSDEQYLRWDYAEDWEISTPYHSDWEFDPKAGVIQRASQKLNIGYCKDYTHPSVVGNNVDFANHEIKNMRLYSVDNLDNRFNFIYCTTVTQRAITKEQYEYEKLKLRQSDDMGGLFTPQPTELPTNISCSDGKYKAIGYIGVTLNAAQKRIYITYKNVGYRLTRFPRILSDEDVAKYKNNEEIYRNGYYILEHDDMTGRTSWIERWGVDSRAWGATLEKPHFWSEESIQ